MGPDEPPVSFECITALVRLLRKAAPCLDPEELLLLAQGAALITMNEVLRARRKERAACTRPAPN